MILCAREILHIVQQAFLRTLPKPKSPQKARNFSPFEVQIYTIAWFVSDV